MTDPSVPSPDDADASSTDLVIDPVTGDEITRDELRERVEDRYDFESFGPAEMSSMTEIEWEVAFDEESWIAGPALLDRVEADLSRQVAERSVFAVLDRATEGDLEDPPADSDPSREILVAYSDEGYAIVFEDGSVEGTGTVLRDVKPTVALCSMDEYEIPETVPASLPGPDDVAQGTGELGNRLLQVIAWVQAAAGIVLLSSPLYAGPFARTFCTDVGGGEFACSVGPLGTVSIVPGGSVLFTTVAGIGFLVVSTFLFLLVANARLSDRFRSEAYRDRLRTVGTDSGNPPAFLPVDLSGNTNEE